MAAAESAIVHLAPGRDKAVKAGHPWVFSGAVDRIEGSRQAATARVLTASGEDLGLGIASLGGQIPVRLVGSGPDGEVVEAIDRAFFARRLEAALALRRQVVPAGDTGYRVINAEGDGLPGWTVDRFGDVLVSQITSRGLEALRDDAYAALREAFPGLAILQKNDVSARRRENLPRHDEVIHGEVPERAWFSEGGLKLSAELAGGQKTGFYLDQRENRRRAAERVAALVSQGQAPAVLDLFAHSGAFSLACLAADAARVTAVESAPRMEELTREHLAANDLAAESLEWVTANVFDDLREKSERTERYDLVICDPPPLVPRKRDVPKGSRAYKDLNRLAMARVAPGGYLFTFTCSSAVDGKLFRQILHAAAGEAGVRLQLLAPLGPGPDHPVDLHHPEGEYFKGWMLRRMA